MTNYVVRPTSILTNGGNPSGTVLSNINDNSDATSVTRSTTGTVEWKFRLATAALSASEFVCRVGSSARINTNTAAGTSGISLPSFGLVTAKDAESRPSLGSTGVWFPAGAWQEKELRVRSVDWAKADLATAHLIWSTTAPQITYRHQFSELFATVYAIAQSSAVLSATTMASSSYADVPVTVNNTIGFEATDPQTSLCRKVTVDVQIESGGSGVGTGTIVAQQSQDFTITGTAAGAFAITDTIHIATPLPNGTYKMYARTRRYNDVGEPPNSEGVSAWAASVALVISNPAPLAPSVSTSTNQSTDSVTISVTPATSSGYSSPTVDVQRSDDGGLTWSDVRFASAVVSAFGVATPVVDYEAPRATAVKYRARVNATYTGGFLNTSAWSASVTATTITADDWQIKCPELPGLNLVAARVVDVSNEIDEDLGVFRPIGRTNAVVVVGDSTGWDGSIKVTTSTIAEWSAVKALIEAQKVWLLQSPFDPQRYIRRVGKIQVALSGTPTVPVRRVQIAFVETGKP